MAAIYNLSLGATWPSPLTVKLGTMEKDLPAEAAAAIGPRAMATAPVEAIWINLRLDNPRLVFLFIFFTRQFTTTIFYRFSIFLPCQAVSLQFPYRRLHHAHHGF